jgi:hypothetical protein
VLEKELAAGIEAAQQVSAQMEKRWAGASKAANLGFLEIVDRFEIDAQQAISVLATLFRTLAKAIDGENHSELKPEDEPPD